MVTAPMNRIASSVTPAVAKVAELQSHLHDLEDRSAGLTKKLGKMALGAGAFVALSYGSIQFESGMARANTMANKSQEDFAVLTNQIRDLADIIPIARDQLSDGLYEAISNEVPENNWISFLETSSRTAVGGLAEMKDVVGVTASVVKNYSMEWERANDIQDKIQKTALLGKTSFAELGQYLPVVAGNAASLGVEFEELLGTFAALTGVSGKTSNVATQMGATLNALVKPSSEASKMAEEMGIQFDAAAVKAAGGLIPFLETLDTEIQKHAQENGMLAESIYGVMFGSAEALKGIGPLIGSVKDDFVRKTEEIRNAAGTIDAAFDIMSNTTEANTQLMRNKFANTMDEIVGIIAPFAIVLLEITGNVFGFVRSLMQANPLISKIIVLGGTLIFTVVFMSTAIALVITRIQIMHTRLLLAAASKNTFIAATSRATIASMRFLGAIMRNTVAAGRFAWSMLRTSALIVGNFLIGLVSATAAQWGLNIAMSANPAGAIIIGLIAIGAAVWGLITYWDTVKGWLIDFGKFFLKMSPFYWLIQLIDVVFPGFKDAVKDIFGSVIEWVGKMWDGIKGAWNAITSFLGFGDTEHDVNINDNTSESANEIAAKVTGSEFDFAALNKISSDEALADQINATVNVTKAADQDIEIDQKSAGVKTLESKFTEIKEMPVQQLSDTAKKETIKQLSSSERKTVHQHNEFYQEFILPEDWKKALDEIADAVMEKLTGAIGNDTQLDVA